MKRAIRFTSKEKLSNKLGLESLQNGRWYGKLSYLYEITTNQSSSYPFNVILKINTACSTRDSKNIPLFHYSLNTFFHQLLKVQSCK